ncbi:unnamed protein product (macronuclear) [Paramecium tetraurelia]|uniref:Uncharacterized protein n=1 Tax=Paramecium tetraurelia TaxID=5888 RepID=A0CHW0_PARTE|nr:uncharacterized protein GSPATT00038479001 [Paramecium tetraurelia]CAK70377.1 unnamed protein product [Paramecium tetraurelia]|eukprot:XP_001437774.1 hypothetical protein (macronuclear) [Paramecium tetraurelia strain d4-2]
MYKFCSSSDNKSSESKNVNQVLATQKENLDTNLDNLFTLLDIIDDQLDANFIQKQQQNQESAQSQANQNELQYQQELEGINTKLQRIILDLKAAEQNQIFEKQEEMVKKFEELKKFAKEQYLKILLKTPKILKDNNFVLTREILEKVPTDTLIDLQEQLIQLEKWQEIVNFYQSNQIM